MPRIVLHGRRGAAAACKLGFAIAALSACGARAIKDPDIVIYGGTSAGVAAAVQAARMEQRVVLIEPGQHLGGMTTSGLGRTDSGNREVIGGLSREFYQRVRAHYNDRSSWVYEDPADFPGYPHYSPNDDALWAFEPKVAEKIFEELIAETKVPVIRGERLRTVSSCSTLCGGCEFVEDIRLEQYA